MGKKYYSYDDFVKKDPARAERLFSTKLMPTDDAVRTARRTTEQDNAVRSLAVERLMEQSNRNVVGPATRRDVSIPIPFIGNVKIQNGDHFRENNLSNTTPVREVGYNPTVSPYTTSVADRLKAQIEGTPVNKNSVDQALAKLLSQRQSDAELYYADKDISEKPVSMLSNEEKQAIKNEYESIDNHNFFQTRGDLALNDETERKQQLYSNYREIKNEDAYAALKLHGMSDAEIQMLNGNPLSEEEINQLQMQGKTDDEINRIANARFLEMEKARGKYEALIASVDDSWGVSVDDITNMIEDRYANPEVQKMALESPVASSIYTLGANPFESAAEVGANVYNYMTGRPIQNYQTGTELIRNAITEDIDSQLGKTAYGGAMSIGDMAVAMGLAYGTGGGSIVNAGIQALEKAAQKMGESADRGLAPDQIFAEGIASGVTTYLTEKVPYGMFERVAKNGLTNYTAKEIGKYLGSMFMSEGLQEATEDVADWAVDAAVAWDKNEFNTDVQSLISQGIKPEDAAMKVISDRFTEATTDFVIGGIGGAHMGSVSTGIASYLGKVNNNPSVYTNKILNSPAAFREMINAVNSIDTSNLEGEDLTRVEHAKEVAQEIANKPKNDIKEEQIVDIANVLNEQANPENDLANTINSINYQASFDTSKQEYEKNKSITPVEGETELEKAARRKAESIAVQEDKQAQAEQRQREKLLRDYQIKGLKSELGTALAKVSLDFENEYAAKTFLDNYKDQNAALYSTVSLQAYHAGESGQSFETFLNNSVEAKVMLNNGVTESYLKTLFYQGQNQRTEDYSTDFKVAKNPNRGKATGDVDELTPLKQKIAEYLGVEVSTDFEKAVTRGDFQVALAKIIVGANSDNQYTALMHEVFEFARAYNPKGMAVAEKAIVDMLVAKRGERAFINAVNTYKNAYREAGKNAKNYKGLSAEEIESLSKEADKSFSDAQEEFINDVISYIFSTDEGIKTFTDFIMGDEKTTHEEKMSAIQAIKDFVDHLIKTIKNFLSGAKNQQYGYEYARLANFNTEELENVSRYLTGVLQGAKEELARKTESGSGKVESKEVAHSIKVIDKTKIKEDAKENIKTVASMDAVATLPNTTFVKGEKALSTQVLEFFDSIGNSAENPILGSVDLTERGIKDSIAHGKMTRIRAMAFKSVPDVIEKGKIVSYEENWKGRNYDTAVIIAPIKFEDFDWKMKDCLEAVVVIRKEGKSANQRFYLHSAAILPEGATSFSKTGVNSIGISGSGDVAPSINRLLQEAYNYKIQNSDSTQQDIVEGATEQQIEDIPKKRKFSVDVPIEQTKDLIAVHNIHEDELIKTLELGGFPMPSIAITKAEMGHDMYGAVSVLFRKNTIDPKNWENKVYSGDAYTPEFPSVDYKINEAKTKKIESKIENLLKDIPYADKNLVSLDASNVEDIINRRGGDFVDAYSNKDILKNAYLSEKGLIPETPMKKASIDDYVPNDVMIKIADLVDDNETVDKYDFTYKQYETLKEDGRLDKIIEILNAYEKEHFKNEKAYERFHTKEINEMRFDRMFKEISNYKRNGIQDVIDYAEAGRQVNQLIQDNKADYEDWIRDLFKGVIEKQGIRNEKEYINSAGNRRTWNQLHYEYTLENIVRAMKEKPSTGQGVGGYSFIGSATREFESIDDIKSQKDRLKVIDEDKYSELTKGIADDLNKIAARISNKTDFGEYSTMSDIAEAVAKNKTAAGIKKFLSQWYKVTDNDVTQILALKKRVEELPTGYFEAKPQRAVGLDEIAAVVIPNIESKVNTTLKNLLAENNIPTVEYKAGDKQSRIDAVNSVENIRFSLSVPVSDSEGRKLSKEQQEYFKDSKIRDEEGNLLKVYHGSMADFTVFDIGEARDSEDIEAFFFSPVSEEAEGYGNTRAFYLNITNPADFDTAYDIFFKHRKENPAGAGARAREELISLGYDGVAAIDSSDPEYPEYLAFYPEQIKLVSNTKPTKNEDIRFSLSVSVDSEGNKLSEGQQEFFRNSKVRDDQGRLMVMYHGTPNGDYTVFRGGSYFTPMRWYADLYQGQGASMLTYKQKADNPTTFAEYLNIEKPFDTRDPEARRIFEEEFYRKWGTGTPLMESGLPDWTDAEDLLEFIEENELDYDGIIVDEGGLPQDDGSVKSRGFSWIPVNGREQVKDVDNLNPTKNPDRRFSVDVSADAFFDAFQEVEEQVKIDESDLEKFIKNGDLDSDVTKKAVKDVASAIKKQYNSNIKLDRLTADIMSVFKYLKSTGNMSMKDIMFVMKEIARPVLEDVKTSDPEQEKMYKDFINKLKGYKISLDAGQTAEVAHSFGSYYEFQRAMNGKMNLSKNGTPLDNIWTELCDISDGHLSYGTNPNDQPLALAEYIYGLQPSYQTMEGETLDDAATDLALEIFRQFYVYQSMTDAASKVKGELNRRANEYKNRYKQAYNDALKQVEMERNLNIERLAKELDNLTAEEQEALRTGDALNKAMIENLKADYQRRLDRLRAQSNEKIAREKAKFQNAWITKNLKRERSELKNRVLREVKALQNLIAHPSEGATKHVPINLIKPTIEMLEAINLDNGGRNKAIAERLKKMAEVYESFKGEEYSFDYDERIANDIKELREMFENKSYADLEIMELERVIEIVTALRTQIKNANNLILQGKLKDAQEAASSAMSSVRQSRRYDNAAMNVLNKYANVHLNAYREFRKLSGYMGGAMMDIYEDLDAGSKKEMQIQKDLGAIFQSVLEGKENQKEVKKFISTKKDDLVDIGLTDKNGKPILITRAMRMSLIMHSMNASNMRHVLGSGITIPNMYYFEKGKMDEAYAKGTNYRFVDYAQLLEAIQKNDTAKIEELTKAAEQRIEDMKKDLSPWEQRFLAAAEEMFHEKTGKYINETSLALKGYAIARVKNYFPIKTDAHFTTQEWAGLVQNGSLEGSGVLKERVVSTKPILLEDITNVIERQIRFTSKYAGLAIAVRNFETIMKQTSRSQVDGQLHNLYETIDSVWGASDTKWLKNLMQDIQGGRGEKNDPLSSFLSRLRGQFAGATLAVNVSVAASQAASYPTAGAVLGFKPLMKAMKDMGNGFVKKQGIEELEDINPLLWYRNQGNATQDLADAKKAKLPPGVQKLTNWIEFMDTGTVRTLEYASMYYVDENFTNLEKGSEEYWQKVSEIFSKVVEETQPNYSVLHRPDILRSPNAIIKLFSMFKTQSLQNFGIVYDALGELNAAYRSGNKQWQKQAATKVGNAVGSQVAAATMFSAIKVLAQLLYHRIWKFRDEDDEWSWAKFAEMFGWQLVSTFAGCFMFGSEISDWLKAKLTKTKYYGVELSTVSMINDLLGDIRKATDNADKLGASVTEEEREKNFNAMMGNMYNIGVTVGEFAGVPVNNVKNLVSSIFYYGTDIKDAIETGEFNPSNDSDIIKSLTDTDVPNMYERIYEVYDGDPKRYDKLVDELKEKVAKDNPDMTEDEIADKVEKDVTDHIIKLLKADYFEGNKSMDEVEDYLMDSKDMTEDDAYLQIKKWEGHSSSEYKVMNDTISVAAENPTPENRKAVIEEVKGLVDHGKTKKGVYDSITRAYKEEYIELYKQGKATNLGYILQAAFVTAGFTDTEAKENLNKWLK